MENPIGFSRTTEFVFICFIFGLQQIRNIFVIDWVIYWHTLCHTSNNEPFWLNPNSWEKKHCDIDCFFRNHFLMRFNTFYRFLSTFTNLILYNLNYGRCFSFLAFFRQWKFMFALASKIPPICWDSLSYIFFSSFSDFSGFGYYFNWVMHCSGTIIWFDWIFVLLFFSCFIQIVKWILKPD